MKKIFLFIIFSVFSFNTYSQQKDFFAGMWDINILGSPRGDVTFKTKLTRIDGKLMGELVNLDDIRPITRIDETKTGIIIYFMSSQNNEISLDLEKQDEDHLKGRLMGLEANAIRIKD